MLRLPKKIGPFTLMRKLGADGVAEAFAGILDEPAGKQVVIRRIQPFLLQDPAVRAATEARIQDLKAIRHPTLVPILDLVQDGDDRYVIEEWVDAVSLRTLLDHCADTGTEIPHNVYLNLATQICNGLEALHGRPGSASGSENVLHLSLRPGAVFVTATGKVVVGSYGLSPNPTALPKAGASGATPMRMEYLSPEQTQPDQGLTPASDIFSLGAILYELLANESLFKAESNLQTIHRVRRAEVTAQLLRVKEMMPGLDKVLYRALSLNPRHRYQRAFVLREDLRGLMAGYSFAHITDETNSFLAPMFQTRGTSRPLEAAGREDSGFEDTASILRHSLSESGKDPSTLNEAPEDTSDLPGRPGSSPNDTAAYLLQAGGLAPAADPDDISVTEPGPVPGGQETSWHQKPLPGGGAAKPDETSWFQTAKGSDRPNTDEAERPTDFALPPEEPSERPTEVDAEPVPASLGKTPETYYDDNEDLDWQPKRSNTPLLIGGGIAAALLAALVCTGVVGGGVFFGTRADPPQTVAVAPKPAPAPEPAAQPEPDAVASVDPAPSPAASPKPGVQPAASPQPAARPSASPQPAARPAASPQPAARPAASPQPAARPAASSASPRPAPAESPSPRPAAPRPAPKPAPSQDIAFELGDLSQYSDKAYRGSLAAAERDALTAIDRSDADEYTRAQVLLYQDAKARDDLAAREQALEGIMSVPENQYNPQFLAEQAEIAIRNEDYDTALERANLAERHWARLPNDLIFTRKAMIFEIQASAHQGRFYESGGEDLDALYQAIRSWEKYQRHVQTKSREDLTVRAEDQLAKLYDMKRRLEQP